MLSVLSELLNIVLAWAIVGIIILLLPSQANPSSVPLRVPAVTTCMVVEYLNDAPVQFRLCGDVLPNPWREI